MTAPFVNKIFENDLDFDRTALEWFIYQYRCNKLYREWCDLLGCNPASVSGISDLSFLPISFFKTSQVLTNGAGYEAVFESSGTTKSAVSRHYIRNLSLYEKSFTTCFQKFYGEVNQWCVLCLLPSYLERKNSSLIFMADALIRYSQHPQSGFYLYNFSELSKTLAQTERRGEKVLLLGVTFALLDFARLFPQPLQHTVIIETGGMKGRGKELIRDEVHRILNKSFSLKNIHAEYGMTELLSQAYSQGEGIFHPPPWMKVFVRDEDDPLKVKRSGKGVLNIIDLANADSCSFIATDDVGMVNEDGSFTVLGRLDTSDMRGCSLLAL